MKRAVVLTVCALLLLSLGVNASFGRPDYRKQIEATYKTSKIAGAIKEANCNVCHYGKTKKNRNDYGIALSKLLSEENYKKMKKDPEELNKQIVDALKAVNKEKSVTGKTFGEMIDAGQLPGTAPADGE